MTHDEGMEMVRRAVADSLALDLDAVRPQSRLITDLSADSLDFLDLIFTLEETFSVKLSEGEMEFFSRLDLNSPKTMNGEFIKREAIESLRAWLPALGNEPDLDCITPARLYSLITVETLWLLVKRQSN